MAKTFKRTDRVASELQKQLSLILQREINTKKLGMVSVSDVSISSDLAYAKVQVTFIDIGESSNYTTQEKIKELNKQVPYIRSLLAKQVLLRIVPEIKFSYDDTIDKQDHMNRLLNSLK